MGKFDTFNEHEETWESYVERFEMFTTANGIQNDLKKSHLISLMGAKTYALLKNLASPTKPSDLSYEAIKEHLTKHLSPKPSKIAERFRFLKRDQKPTETINEYVAELKGLTK